MEIRIYRERCKGVEECGLCLHVCKKQVFRPSEGLNLRGYRPPEIENEKACTACENCMIFCPDFAVAVAGKRGKRGGQA